MKKVDGKLLQKYFSGLCSNEEKELVELWMQSTQQDERLDMPATMKERYRQKMWLNISENIRPSMSTNRYLTPIFIRYAAVACLASVLIWCVWTAYVTQTTEQQTHYSNSSPKRLKKIQTESLDLMLLPGSELYVDDGACRIKGKIDFCGDFVLRNNQECDVFFKVTSSCRGAYYDRVIKLKAGKKYLVYQYKSKSRDTHVITEATRGKYMLQLLFQKNMNEAIGNI